MQKWRKKAPFPKDGGKMMDLQHGQRCQTLFHGFVIDGMGKSGVPGDAALLVKAQRLVSMVHMPSAERPEWRRPAGGILLPGSCS